MMEKIGKHEFPKSFADQLKMEGNESLYEAALECEEVGLRSYSGGGSCNWIRFWYKPDNGVGWYHFNRDRNSGNWYWEENYCLDRTEANRICREKEEREQAFLSLCFGNSESSLCFGNSGSKYTELPSGGYGDLFLKALKDAGVV